MKAFGRGLIRWSRHTTLIILCSILVLVWIYFYVDSVECEKFKSTFEYRYPHNVANRTNRYEDNVVEINNVYKMFDFMSSPSSACSKNVPLLVIVKSAARNFAQRHAIRHTWGKENDYVSVYFSLGYSKDVNEKVENETRSFQDIIQGSFNDIYRNNIFKTSMSYKWVSDHCPHIRFVLFVDDDYFVNVKGIISHMESVTKHGETNRMYGNRGQCWKPKRNSCNEKSYIVKEEYPFYYWPDYLIGGSILTTSEVVNIMARSIPYIKRISIDDSYVGIVAHLLNIDLIDDWRFSSTMKSPRELREHYLAAHGYDEHTLIKSWHEFNNKLL